MKNNIGTAAVLIMRKKKGALFYILGIISVSFGCTAYMAKQDHYQGNVSLLSTVELLPSKAGLLVLPVMINGEKYNFMVDTGADITVLDDSFVKVLNREFHLFPVRIRDTAGGIFESHRYQLPEVEIGGLRIYNKTVITYDFNTLNVREDIPHHISGCIGMDILKDFILQVDFERNEVSIDCPPVFGPF